jgi:hypothetical protein
MGSKRVRQLWIICMAVVLLLQLAVPGQTYKARAETAAATIGPKLDEVAFGSTASESEHSFAGESTSVVAGTLGETARRADPLSPYQIKGGTMKFNMKVDPVLQNYFTLKFSGDDQSSYKSIVYINGEQIGYRRTGDYEAINIGNDNYRAGSSSSVVAKQYPNHFYYNTILLPVASTKGQTEVQIEVRTYSVNYTDLVTAPSRGYYKAYTHTDPYLDITEEQQGAVTPGDPAAILQAETRTDADKQALFDNYRNGQQNLFNQLSTSVDSSASGKLVIIKYQDDMKYYAACLSYDWCPANTNELKKAALERIFKSIDNHVKDYYANTQLVQRGGHQGDWGGYYSPIGDSLYMIENLISNPDIYGSDLFNQFLDQPFVTNTVNGTYSLAGVDWNGGELSRREAWERMLKANFDFARSRLSYIYNQVYYTYEGAWKAHEGLRVIDSSFYEGKARSHAIFREMHGITPFLGEEVLVGPEGQELDLYHSLFYHDTTAVFTRDYEQFVAKGLARSKLDANGKVVRRLPFGENYTTMSEGGLARENNYVGNYGETPNYLPEWFYKTLNHAGDEAINDDILKLALRNIHARSYTRYTDLDDNGKRIMRMEQVLDERNAALPGNYGYATRITSGKALHFASLEMHMANNESRYSSPEWATYWQYAKEAVGFVQQQLTDNQFFNYFSSLTGQNEYDFHAPLTYKYVTTERAGFSRFNNTAAAGVVHPQTDFDYYTPAEISALGVNPDDYDQFAWTDVDTFFLSMRDGDLRIFGALVFRNQGIDGNGKLHVLSKDHQNIVQIATDTKFRYEDYSLRLAGIDNEMLDDEYTTDADRPQALSGEVIPIAYQPGNGPQRRENWEADTSLASTPDLLTARYGKYFILFNSTRSQYGNEETFQVEIPADFSGSSVLDLVSGEQIPVTGGKVSIGPKSAMVLKLTEDVDPAPKPFRVAYTDALPGNGYAGVTWKTAAGAESYTIKRSTSENGPFTVIATGVTGNYYKDTAVQNGSVYFYTVAAVNGNGTSGDSYRTKLDLTGPVSLVAAQDAIWRDDRIGSAGGSQAVMNGSMVSIGSGSGYGLGDGNDNRLLERNIIDSLHFVNRVTAGSSEISIKIDRYQGETSGIMLRDSLSSNTRYVYFGSDDNGNLVLRNRTRDSRHSGSKSLNKMSPLDANLIGFKVQDYPYIKLVREYDSHNMYAYVSKNGMDWELAGKQYTPLPYAVHSGLVASDQAGFSGVAVRELANGIIHPEIKRENGWVTLSWNKPKLAVKFNIYRTYDLAAAKTEPVFKPGSLELAEGSPWTAVASDSMILSYTDPEPKASDMMGYKILGISLDGTYGSFSEAVYPAPETEAPIFGSISIVNNPAGIADKIVVSGVKAGSIVNAYAAAGDLNPIGTTVAGSTYATIAINQIGAGSGILFLSAAEPGLKESARTAKPFAGESGLSEIRVEKDATVRFETAGTNTTSIVVKTSATDSRYGLLTFNNVPPFADESIESVTLRVYRSNTRTGTLRAHFVEWDDWKESDTGTGGKMKLVYFNDSSAAISTFLNLPTAQAPFQASSAYTANNINGLWELNVTEILKANTGLKASFLLSVPSGEVNPVTREFLSGQMTAGQYAPVLIIKYKVNKEALNELVASAGGLVRDDYAASGWRAVQTALSQAQAMVSHTGATQVQVNEAVLALRNAVNDLVSLTGLRAEIAEAKAITNVDGQYTSESFRQLQLAITAAEADLGTAVTQEQIQSALSALRAALSGLRVQGVNLTGPSAVQSGDMLVLIYGLNSVTTSVYAKEVTFLYDPARLEYVDTVSLVNNFSVVLSTYGDGKLRVIEAGIGASVTGTVDILQLRFRALPTMHTVSSSVYMSKVLVADGEGNVAPVKVGPAFSVEIIRSVEGSVLEAKIVAAQAALDAAMIDDRTLYGRYPAAAAAAFITAIQAAAYSLAHAASLDEIVQATAALDASMQAFQASVNRTVSIADLALIARYFDSSLSDAHWPEVVVYDTNNNGNMDIIDLFAIAKKIPNYVE